MCDLLSVMNKGHVLGYVVLCTKIASGLWQLETSMSSFQTEITLQDIWDMIWSQATAVSPRDHGYE